MPICGILIDTVERSIDQDSDNNSGQMNINKQILDELKQLNGRITKVDEKVEKQDKEQVNSPKSVSSNAMTASQNDGYLILPSLSGLRQSSQLQAQVDRRQSTSKASLNLSMGVEMKLYSVNVRSPGPKTLYCRVQISQEHLMIVSQCPNGCQVSLLLSGKNQILNKKIQC